MNKIEKLIAKYGAACATTARAGMSLKNLPQIEVDFDLLRECEQQEANLAHNLAAALATKEEFNGHSDHN